MKLAIRRSTLACAVLGALGISSAQAAVQLNESMDGVWSVAGGSGRGVLVDYLPGANGGGTLAIGYYAYDAEGGATWVLMSTPMPEFEFSAEGIAVNLSSGGNFGMPFSGPTSTVQVGSATIDVASCDSMTVTLDMTEASGLADATLQLTPFIPSEACAYKRAFTSCPSFASAGTLPRSCVLSGDILGQDIVLTNETTWLLDGLVKIGADNASQSSVTIEPGTVLAGDGGTADYLYVNPGSQIFANGTPFAPIILTSINDGFSAETQPSPGDVGGLVVSGNAPSNSCPQAPFNCFSEFDSTQRFGGNNADESSGEISYFQVRYAGINFTDNAEVNAFTFQGVGRGTTVHHIQAYRGQDDGIEFFGGNVNVKYLVVTEGGDDGIDWDLGWSGKIQYALVADGEGFGEDHGIEAANNPDNDDALPRAQPVLSNLTLIGSAGSGDGIRLKEGSAGQIWNSVVEGYPASCINLTNGPTYTAAGTPAQPTGITAFAGVIVNCPTNFKQDDGAPYTTEAFFNSSAFDGNAVADPLLSGYQPGEGSPARTGGVQVPNEFFDYTSHRGAFDGRNDWTAGWSFKPAGG